MKKNKTRHAMNNSTEVIADWLDQKKSHSYCRQAKFSGKIVYSYGTHYQLGLLCKIAGHDVAIVNQQFYSRTTSGQSWHALCAAESRGLLTISVQGSFTSAGILAGLEIEQNTLINDLIFTQQWGIGEYNTIKSDVIAFNKKVKKLGFKKLTIDVPKEFYDFGHQLAKLVARKNKSIHQRKQLAFRFESSHA
jgi:hypothetical protein